MSEVLSVTSPVLPHNLRFTEPPMYGDSFSQSRHASLTDEARRVQHVECAVAPGCSVTSLASGKVLVGADEISLKDVGNEPRALEELVRREVVIRIPRSLVEARKPQPHHTHRVTTLTATSCPRRGILDCGTTVSREDWSYPPRKGFALPGGELVDARPADDGQAAIDELVSRGILEPLEQSKPTKGKAA